MPPGPSRVPEIVDALVDRITAAVAVLPADQPVIVCDGPQIVGDRVDLICVGYDADPDGPGETVSATRSWAGLGARTMDEAVEVACAIHTLSGDTGPTSVRAARQRVYELLGVVEASVHDDPSLGLPPPSYGMVASHRLTTHQTDVGLEMWLTFAVRHTARPGQ
ncbi:MAG: hypothetical protein ACRCZP_14465 [Phycicoccus sp.]